MEPKNEDTFEVKRVGENKYDVIRKSTKVFHLDGEQLLAECTNYENRMCAMQGDADNFRKEVDKIRTLKKLAQEDFMKFKIEGSQSKIKAQAKGEVEKYSRERIVADQLAELKKEVKDLKKCIGTSSQ